jgi:predicted nucleotidyltransferase
LADATLAPAERRALERLVPLLQAELGSDLHAFWLYGSRARGEPPHPDSDIDLLVVADGDMWTNLGRVGKVVDEAALAEGANPVAFAAHVYDPSRLAQRRDIRSFFIQEVDRDKIVLAGEL